MSFSSEAKKEMCRARVRSTEGKKALLAGFLRAAGTLRLSSGGMTLVSRGEDDTVLSLMGKFASALWGLEATVSRLEQEHRRKALFELSLKGESLGGVLEETGLLPKEERSRQGAPADILACAGLPLHLLSQPGDRTLFLRGCFLGSGTCADPKKEYRLDILCGYARDGEAASFPADSLKALLATFDIPSKSTLRKGREVLYLSGDAVSAFLALAGAPLAVLEWENEKAVKEYRNKINRQNNRDVANMGKAITAGLEQIHAIDVIEEHMSLTDLPDSLYDAARLRLSHPHATLQELADMAEIGKSGMNHRLQRLLNLAKEFEA